MVVTVYLTLGLFPSRWQDPANQSLWLIVQPHVRTTDFADWMSGADSGANHRYALLTPADVPPEDNLDFVAVPFASAMGITLQLLKGDRTPLGAALVNDRSGLVVPAATATQFTSDNVRPWEDPTQPDTRVPMPPGPIAAGIANQLEQAFARDPASAQNMLMLGFWGGTLRRIRPTTVTQQGKVDLLAVTPRLAPAVANPAEVTSTSQLAIAGHMLRLDKTLGIAGLQQAVGFQLFVHPNGQAPDPSRHLVDTTAEQPFFAAYLARLTPAAASIPSPAVLVTAQQSAAISNRVYVRQQLSTLPGFDLPANALGANPTRLFRKSPEGTKAPTRITLGDVERLVIHVGTARTFPPAPAPIQVAIYDTIDGRLVPYRSARVQPGNLQLLQFVPAVRDRARFIQLFHGQGASWPTGSVVLGSDGARVTASDGSFLEAGFVGWFTFPWDDPDNADPTGLTETAASLPTALFYADAVVLNHQNVTLVVPQRDQAGNAISLTAVPAGVAAPDALGPRWEWRPPGPVPDVAVGAALCAADAALLPYLILGVALADDHTFEFARSASFVEGVIQATYPTVSTADLQANPPDADFRREVAHYNALNVYATQTDAGGAVVAETYFNPWSELYPIYRDDVGGRHRQVFHFRYTLPVYAPLPTTVANSTGPADEVARNFFAVSFGQLKTARNVVLDLQHTVGDWFELKLPGDRLSSPTFHDTPPIVGPEIRRRSSDVGASSDPFVTVEFVKATAATPEIARLTLRVAYLNALRDAGNNPVPLSKDSVLLSAWAAVAELANADTIALTGRFRRFDVALAASTAVAAGKPMVLADGLTPIAPYEDHLWVVPRIQNACIAWLGGAARTVDFIVDIPLTISGALNSIAESCHLVEFRLVLTRAPNLVPAPTGWTFVTARETASNGSYYDANGLLVDSVTPIPREFATYQKSLAVGTAVIPPIATQQKDAAGFRDRFAPDQPDGSPSDNTIAGEWLLPEGAAITGGDSILAVLLALAFRPLASVFGGVANYQALCRFCDGLQILLDAGPAAWTGQPTTLQGWQAWFTQLYQARAGVTGIMGATRSLIVAADDKADPKLDSTVASAIGALFGSGGASPATAIALGELVLRNPGLFSAARALLVTQLRGATGQNLPTDLFQLSTQRTIPPPNSSATQRVESTVLDARGAMLQAVNPRVVPFLETLGSEKYDASFTIGQFGVYGLEALIDAQATGAAPAPLALQSIHTADGPAAAPQVFLPSRQPLISPVFRFADRLRACDAATWIDSFAGGQLLSRSALLDQHQIAIGAGSDGLTLIAATLAIAASDQIDIVKMSAVFYVTSDEDDQFDNDEFVIAFDPASAGSAGGSSEPDPSSAVKALFKDLSTDLALAKLGSIATIVTSDALAFARSALLSPSPAFPNDSYFGIGIDRSRKQLVLPSGLTLPTEAFLFGPAAGVGPTTYVLIVNCLVPVWRPTAIGIGQTRNRRALGTHRVHFDRSLWQWAATVGSDRVLSIPPDRSTSLKYAPTSWPAAGVDVAAFIRSTFVAHGLLADDPAPNSCWLSHDISVTVSAVQQGIMMGVYPDNQVQPTQASIVLDHGRIPRAMASWSSRTQSGVAIVLDSRYLLFQVDFVWTDFRNTELLRVTGLQVTRPG